MNSSVNNPLFTELNEEETAALNGGRFCRFIWVRQRVRIGWRFFIRTIRVVRCF
ncbi:hypothetical protein [Egbenema bharatensis]|uniref:hypothetical protein n=1 Tax=Egbenema bharatensis TaxID=3463334 RepID=UPI003A85E909